MIRRIFHIWILSLFAVAALVSAQEDITVPELEEHLYFLASDSLKGRKPGTDECKIAAQYIRDRVNLEGVQLLGDDGFQSFEVIKSFELGDSNLFSFAGFRGTPGEDYIPLSFSDNTDTTAEVVFVDYGFEINTDSLTWNSYDGVDATGKWAMVLQGDPEMDKQDSPFALHSSLRKKALVAKDHGAAGVLFVSGEDFDKDDDLIKLGFDRSQASGGLPIINIKRTIADQLLQGRNTTISQLEKQVNETRQPLSVVINTPVHAITDVIKTKANTQNVVALLPSSDPLLKKQIVVLGAHYDHLGFGGEGSGSRRPDTLAIHNGADDNASGVSGILEIFEKLHAHRQELRRSILFIAFSAEEMGTLGSKYFVDHPLVDLDNIVFMLNLDMIGRLNTEEKNENFTVAGNGTGVGLTPFVEQLSQADDMHVKLSPEGYGPSDHASFYVKDIPVLFFHTGAHEDYHTPDDDADKINYPGLKTVADFAYDVLVKIANRDEVFAFQQAGPKEETASRRYRLRVTLGIMPDYAGTESNGLRVDAVMKGRPAERAGMLKGDVIFKMEGKSVSNIYDYMNRLAAFHKGQVISVEVHRGDKDVILIVEL
jgi:aminopeptidase YwaD